VVCAGAFFVLLDDSLSLAGAFFVLLENSLSLLTRAYSDFPGDVAFGGEVTAETGRRLLPGSAGCQSVTVKVRSTFLDVLG